MVLFCVCFEGVVLPLSPELSKEMVILMKYQQPTHSKNGQVLKIKKKKKKSIITKKISVTASSLCILLFKTCVFLSF